MTVFCGCGLEHIREIGADVIRYRISLPSHKELLKYEKVTDMDPELLKVVSEAAEAASVHIACIKLMGRFTREFLGA